MWELETPASQRDNLPHAKEHLPPICRTEWVFGSCYLTQEETEHIFPKAEQLLSSAAGQSACNRTNTFLHASSSCWASGSAAPDGWRSCLPQGIPRLFHQAAAPAEEHTHRSPKRATPMTDKCVYAMKCQLALDTLSQTSVKQGSCNLRKSVGTHLQLSWPLAYLLYSMWRNGDEEVFWWGFGGFFAFGCFCCCFSLGGEVGLLLLLFGFILLYNFPHWF